MRNIQKDLSYDYKLLRHYAEALSERVWRKIPSSVAEIRNSLSFMESTELSNSSYGENESFKSLCGELMKKITLHEFQQLVENVKKSYEEEDGDIGKAAVHLLLEAIGKVILKELRL